MSAYPSVGIVRDSQRTIDSGVTIDRSDDGSVRGRCYYGSDLNTFELVHDLLTPTERDLILAHYAAHRTATFSFTWPATGTVYSAMLYVAAPKVVALAGQYSRVTVTLTGR